MALDFFAKRKLRKEIKQLETQIASDKRPDLMLRLAGLYRKMGNDEEAKEQYYNVTMSYLESNRRGQAEAVCKSVLEYYPGNKRFEELFNSITGSSLVEKTPEPTLPPPVSPVEKSEQTQDEDSEDDEIASMMDEYSEPEELTPVAEFSASKHSAKSDWKDEDSDPDGSRIPTPPSGVPSIRSSLQETLSSRFSAVSSQGMMGDGDDEVLDDDNSMFGGDFFQDTAPTVTRNDFDPSEVTKTEAKTPSPEVVNPSVSLSEAPLIRELPPEIMNALLELVSPRTYDPGEYIVREGDTGTSLFVILQGQVNVTKLTSGGEENLISSLKAGDFFGEFALLADHRRHASIVTLTETKVIEIPKSTIVDLGKKHPELLDIIKKFYRQRLMDLMIKSLDFFTLISSENREKYLGDIHFHRFAPRTQIIRQGQKSGGFFLILIGEVEIVFTGDAGEKLLGVLGEGEYFGEMALMKRQSAMATVKSKDVVELVQIPAKTFFQILADHPPVWRKMQEEVKKRELLDHYFISGNSTGPVTYSS
ncbi:cyclic nucleotide-binding domain-containing protein [Myxococcota bacterium]|nr:cyclic nucleotide-binding domain-containing protein [Myxococcota bacterium]MBU1379712.1 cyclic nucleotide-binding domain-containing protein [Myxococcota bacterium]MBU1496130.1 cyclic nucleotide-binding domain-containing protein [Myxococcota bacterium]